MRIVLFIFMLSTSLYAQCDANNDGNLDIFDLIEQVNCILEDCWNLEEETTDIYDYWMVDSMSVIVSIGGFPIQSLSIYCEESDTVSVMNFNEDGYTYNYPVESVYCGAEEVALPDTFLIETLTINGDSISIFTTDDYGYPQILNGIYNIDEDILTLSFSESLDEVMEGAEMNMFTYLHRVSILGFRKSSTQTIDENLNLNYIKQKSIDRLLKDIQAD